MMMKYGTDFFLNILLNTKRAVGIIISLLPKIIHCQMTPCKEKRK